jgi:hypothetical protein
MITNKLIPLIGLLALAVPCLGAPHFTDKRHHDGQDKSCISFPEFLEQVKHATFEDYSDTKVESKEAFQDIKDHVLGMYDGVCVEEVTSFVLEEEYGDCLKIEEQPTVRQFGIQWIEKPPPDLTCPNQTNPYGHVPGTFEYVESPLKLGLKDRFGNPISCPKNKIPMARLTLEKLTRFSTLNDFFAKSSQELVPLQKRQAPQATGHLHAVGIENVDNFGGNSWLNLWNPKVYDNSDFSLSQQWYVGGEGANRQTVEGGWQVYPQKYDTNDAVLFIYRTAANYTAGSGCYNLDCTGFVQINHNWYLGGIWDHYSTTNGTQWGFELQWKLYNKNWWLWLKGPGDYEAVGYYPTSLFNGGQMSEHATKIEYGGEVYRAQSGHSWPQMGSGAPASKGFGQAAFQNLIFYTLRDENGGVGAWGNLGPIVESSCYSIDITNANGGSWGTYFFFGGQGANTC